MAKLRIDDIKSGKKLTDDEKRAVSGGSRSAKGVKSGPEDIVIIGDTAGLKVDGKAGPETAGESFSASGTGNIVKKP